MINWRVRVKNVNFWATFIPAVYIFIQCVAGLFGVTIDLSGVSDRTLAVIHALFAILAMVGVVNDPTTESLKDSNRAMTYEKPH